ncbi:SMP-30/gluconolactonase/LRE family protein [Streptomyces sp. SP2-10]|uniref:SMP-30/gluconolactonase/LRE family protein n=1 Tax=Streptomyces sp. SP2-10 TaxID=2873385 RepID=UPI001CA769FE|nr:hypothetical protein [Streptomyces sp. SP2-10]MBY8840740.1 hypothetical protein [Streptomyces sp. SP2-10]
MERPGELVPLHYVSLGAQGPEDVLPDPHGRVLTGVADGRILRLHHLGDPRAARVEVLAETGGRPLGLELLPDGDLLVCDAERGLLRVGTGDGTVRVLADSVAGEPLRFCSNAVALADGSVYATVSSRRHSLDRWIGDIVEHTGTGRPYRPSGTTGVIAVDDQGRTVHHLARRRSGFRMVTSVGAVGDHLVLGSVWESGVAVCARPAAR